jgi:hypothetical protein
MDFTGTATGAIEALNQAAAQNYFGWGTPKPTGSYWALIAGIGAAVLVLVVLVVSLRR